MNAPLHARQFFRLGALAIQVLLDLVQSFVAGYVHWDFF